MLSSEFIADAVDFGAYPESTSKEQFIERTFTGALKIEDVSANLALFKKDEWLTIVRNESEVLGGVKLSERIILNKQYEHVDIIYILPEFRHTTAIKWLIYAVKEYSKFPVIADGAIFKDGSQLIKSLSKHGATKVKSLNTVTGEILPVDSSINDFDLCYLFESTKLGPGKNYLTTESDRGNGWIWYADSLFDLIK